MYWFSCTTLAFAPSLYLSLSLCLSPGSAFASFKSKVVPNGRACLIVRREIGIALSHRILCVWCGKCAKLHRHNEISRETTTHIHSAQLKCYSRFIRSGCDRCENKRIHAQEYQHTHAHKHADTATHRQTGSWVIAHTVYIASTVVERATKLCAYNFSNLSTLWETTNCLVTGEFSNNKHRLKWISLFLFIFSVVLCICAITYSENTFPHIPNFRLGSSKYSICYYYCFFFRYENGVLKYIQFTRALLWYRYLKHTHTQVELMLKTNVP